MGDEGEGEQPRRGEEGSLEMGHEIPLLVARREEGLQVEESGLHRGFQEQEFEGTAQVQYS